MSISEDLKSARINQAIGCKVCYYLDVMNTNDADMMRSALKKKKLYSHTTLAEIFTNNNMNVSESSIRRHRKHL